MGSGLAVKPPPSDSTTSSTREPTTLSTSEPD
jgi:hypothetical protein